MSTRSFSFEDDNEEFVSRFVPPSRTETKIEPIQGCWDGYTIIATVSAIHPDAQKALEELNTKIEVRHENTVRHGRLSLYTVEVRGKVNTWQENDDEWGFYRYAKVGKFTFRVWQDTVHYDPTELRLIFPA